MGKATPEAGGTTAPKTIVQFRNELERDMKIFQNWTAIAIILSLAILLALAAFGI